MEIHQLQYFVMIAEEGSFLRASKRAFISQQALSRSINNLENELGVQLFNRGNAGVDLTDYGVILLNRATHFLALIDATFEEINEVTKDKRQKIRVGMTSGLIDTIDLKSFFSFQDANPQWTLSFCETSDKDIENGVLKEQLDLGLVSGIGDETLMNYRLVLKTPTCIALHASHWLADREALSLRELNSEVFLAGPPNFFNQKTFIEACKNVMFVPKTSHFTSNVKTVKMLLLLNRGVFACPITMIPQFQNEEVRCIPLIDDPYIYRVYLINKKGRELPKPVTEFRDFVQNTLILPYEIPQK